MSLAKFPPKKRPDGLTTIVAMLGLILYAVLFPFAAAPVAPPVHLSPVPAHTPSRPIRPMRSWPATAAPER